MNRSVITACLFGVLLVVTTIIGNQLEDVRGEGVSFNFEKMKFDYVQQDGKGIAFGGDSTFPALPADFFDPGSLPFEGLLPLRGVGNDPVEAKGKTSNEKGGTIDINIGVGNLQECDLATIAPFVVNFGDGSTQQWDMTINLNPLETSDVAIEFTHNPVGGPDGGSILPVDSFFDIFAEVTFSHTPPGGAPRFRSFAIIDRTRLTTTNATWAHLHSSIAGGADRDFVPGADPANPSAPLQVLLFEGGGLDLPLRLVDIVPEPSSLALFALSTIAAFAARSRRRRRM